MSYEKICTACHKKFSANDTVCPFCDTGCPNANPGGTLPEGVLLAEKYIIGRVTEVDGEGITYEAVENESGLPVVIKEYLPVTLCARRDENGAVVVKAGSEVPYKTTMVDFVDLYKSLMQLGTRPGLSAIKGLLKENNTVYAVLGYAKSITLTDWLNRQTDLLTYERCIVLLEPVLDGLAAMHAAGLIHRGVSPDNIRVTPDGRTFLAGYATLALRSLNSELKPSLCEGYSAPEQYSVSEFQGPYTDVYSVAAVLYKMLAGTAPVAAGGRGEGCPTLKQIGSEVSAQVSRAVDHAMWGNTARRTQTIAALREELSGGDKNGVDATRVVPAVSGQGGKFNSRQALIVGGFVVALLLVVLLIWLMIRGMVPKAPTSSTSLPQSSSVVATPSPTPGPTVEPTVKVPSFVGQLYTDIQANTEYQKNFIFNVTEEYSDNVDKGKVISQTPVADADRAADHRVDLVVSKGRKSITVPDFRNYTRGDVVTILTGAGIKAENIRFAEIQNDGTMSPGLSVKADREVGSEMNPELDTITVYMAGPIPTPTPTPINISVSGA